MPARTPVAPGRRAPVAVCASAAVLLLAVSARADDAVLPPPADWAPLTFAGIGRHTEYAPAAIDGTLAVRASSECAASALVVATSDVDLAATPRLTWRWKVEQPMQVADETGRAGDDFAARVSLMFRFESARATWWERARRSLLATIYDQPLPGAILYYVWASDLPIGTTFDDPRGSGAKGRVLASGQGDGWRTAEVEVAADYRARFGTAPPPLLGVALMTDTDDTCQRAVSYFADFRFTP